MMVVAGTWTRAVVCGSKMVIENALTELVRTFFIPKILFQMFRSPANKWLSCLGYGVARDQTPCNPDTEVSLGLIGLESTEHECRILTICSLKGDGQFPESGQGDKTSSSKVRERKFRLL
jgi:hypothetical protein